MILFVLLVLQMFLYVDYLGIFIVSHKLGNKHLLVQAYF